MIRNTPLNMKQLAHDVNGLMACAQLSVDSLADSQDSLARKRAFQLQNVIDNTVRYCRQIMETTQAAEPKTIRIETILKNIKSLLSPLSADGKITIEMQETSTTMLIAHEVSIHRAITNLGRNALIAMQSQKSRNLTFKVWGPPNLVWIDIIDEGPGLGSDAMGILQHGTNHTVIKNGRSRFGLCTTAALASKLGGELSVVKTGRNGTTMRLSFPRFKMPASAGLEK